MPYSDRARCCRTTLASIELPDHEREWAVWTLVRAEIIADAIVATVRLPRALLRFHRRHAGYPHPHPAHE